ncbi:MAG: DUF3108 domain-containing protein [Alphaproteobacteria bacterium]|nr:DUF3108 domain-containing protein [Alphaproteobacteria bacterium]
MTRRSTALLLIAAGLLLAAAPLSPPTAADEPDRIDMRIEMYAVAGLHVMTIREGSNESGDRYELSMEMQSRGLADLFTDISSRSVAQGRIVKERLVPESLRSDTKRNGSERHTRATYGPDGALSGEVTPPFAEPRTPVKPEQLRGTIDELTAYYQLERQLARTGSCASLQRVFDGFRRYDLVFADLAPEVLKADAEHRYAGPTEVCEVTRNKIGGFPVSGQAEELAAGRMWFARLLPGPFMVPVKMEFDTELGIVTGYLAELRGRGVNLALTE